MAGDGERIEADYVVVGAGSAGCVVAARLAEDGARVVLLEAGPRDWHPLIHVPAGFLRLLANPAVNWNFATAAEDGIAGRSLPYPRGRVIGGSGSINGMLYVRGNPADYDGWAQAGCRGWSYAEVLPVFKLSERYAGGEDAYRGREGPMQVADYGTVLPATRAFVAAAEAAGIAFNADMNGAVQEGVGHSQMTRAGRLRQSTATTYLAAARRRPNLRIETGALAQRLVFEGRRCAGVVFRQGGGTRQAAAAAELVLAAGAIGSPQLLQVSGVGPAPLLGSLGVEVVHDLPGVGENLTDHVNSPMIYRLRGTESINRMARMPRLAREIVRWLVFADGALTFGVTSSSAFVKSRADLASPDLQLMFTPASFDRGRFGELERQPGATVSVCLARPASRGRLRARDADAASQPEISPNYLTDPRDMEAILAGMRLARRIAAAEPLAGLVAGEVLPGAALESDAELADYTRRTCGSVYHPVGTCRMGVDPMAVVDERLRVRGIAGLRVIDASIMPTITTGNTNAPTVMIAEKGAAMIRDDARA